MKKQDRIRTAKAVALALANGHPFEQWQEKDKALAAEGCKLVLSGPREYVLTDKDGQQYVFFAQKKQVLQYTPKEYADFYALDKALASALTQEDVYNVAVALDAAQLPASLKNRIEEGIERTMQAEFWHKETADESPVEAYRVETPFDNLIIDTSMMAPLPEEPKAEEPKPEPKKAAKPKAKKAPKPKKPKKPAYVTPAMKELAARFEGVTFTCKGEGCCLWAEADRAKHGKALEKEGFVWSGKRNAYYRKAA